MLNALWSAGAEGIQMQDQRIIGTSAPRCVGNTLLLNGRTYSPPYVDHRDRRRRRHAGGAGGRPVGDPLQAVRVRFGLGYTEERRRRRSRVRGTTEPVRCASPSRPGRSATDRSSYPGARCRSWSSTTTTASCSTWSSTWASSAWTRRSGATTTSGWPTDAAVAGRGFDGVLLSPGPGTPERAGASIRLVRACAAAETPLLGVCLGPPGHRRRVRRHRRPRTRAAARQDQHRVPHRCRCAAGLPDPFTATRYHSLTILPDTVPADSR